MQYVHLRGRRREGERERERGGGKRGGGKRGREVEGKGRREWRRMKMRVVFKTKKKFKNSSQRVRDSYLPMIIAANGVSEAQIVHILKDIFFFLSAVAVMFCLSKDVQIRAV
jgi:hypothetical protein